MKLSVIALISLVLLFSYSDEGNCQQCSSLTSPYCYRQRSQLNSRAMQRYVIRYRSESYATYTSCGWLWQDRCRSGTSYRRVSYAGSSYYTGYYTTYTTERYCCSGYRERSGSCEPICNCINGQTCIAPYTCRRGVELRLNGLVLTNNTILELSQISSTCATLVCTTDLHSSPTNTGRWYYPNKTEIGTLPSTNGLYITHGGYREVYLHRRNDIIGPFGNYCCDHYNARISRETLCIQIVEHVCNPPCHMGHQCVASNTCISVSMSMTHVTSPAFFIWTSSALHTRMQTNAAPLGSQYQSTALKIKSMANTSVMHMLTTKSTIADSEHSMTNQEKSSSGIGLLTYVVPGVVGVVILIIVTITMVIGIIQCRKYKCVPATSLDSTALQFDNKVYDTNIQHKNVDPQYEEIPATKAEDYEAFVPNKPVNLYDTVNDNPAVLKKQISYEMSQCPAYRDRTLKKQN